MAGITAVKVDDCRVQLDGDSAIVAQALMQIRMEGRFGRVVNSSEVDGRTTTVVELQLPEGSSVPSHVTQAPQTRKRKRLTRRQRRVAIRGMQSVAVLGAGGLAVWGAVLGVLWLWSLVLVAIPYIVFGLALVIPALWITFRPYRGKVHQSTRMTSVRVPESVRDQVFTVHHSPDASIPSPYHWWGGVKREPDAVHAKVRVHDKPSVVYVPDSASDSLLKDPLTRTWLARLRDPHSDQSIGRWYGDHLPYESDVHSPEFQLAINSDARCGVGYLLDSAHPGYDGAHGRNGKKHPAYRAMEQKYGRKLIRDVISLNDRGYPLKKIADHVERRMRRGRQ